MTLDIAAAKAGKFTAVFPDAATAKAFYDRLSAGGFYVTDVKRNRSNGRIVTFTATEQAYQNTTYAANPDRTQAIMGYWTSMAETVGYYGSTFGEPPSGAGARTATLNGRPCPATM